MLNASYEPLMTVPWQKAVTMVMTGDAVIEEADEDRRISSPSVSIPFPRVVRLIRYVKRRIKASKRSRIPSRHAVLRRDGYRCAYCGCADATTVDHVLPKSRGGPPSWENLVACCAPCNGEKRDRTPEEAGLVLRIKPRAPWL